MWKHAALDALVSRKISELLQSKNSADNSNLRQAMLQIEKDDVVSNLVDCIVAATGIIAFLESNRC